MGFFSKLRPKAINFNVSAKNDIAKKLKFSTKKKDEQEKVTTPYNNMEIIYVPVF